MVSEVQDVSEAVEKATEQARSWCPALPKLLRMVKGSFWTYAEPRPGGANASGTGDAEHYMAMFGKAHTSRG